LQNVKGVVILKLVACLANAAGMIGVGGSENRRAKWMFCSTNDNTR
jgi:hypothetical protein